MQITEYNNPREAFDRAIRESRLSDNPRSCRYAGRFMYMGRWDGVDQFKHTETRQYLSRPSSRSQSDAGCNGTAN